MCYGFTKKVIMKKYPFSKQPLFGIFLMLLLTVFYQSISIQAQAGSRDLQGNFTEPRRKALRPSSKGLAPVISAA
jgi:hypothetical protein